MLRISFLLGLFEAKTTRFPDSFFMLGVWRAWDRVMFCFEVISMKCGTTDDPE
jgi:hypothetical protein